MSKEIKTRDPGLGFKLPDRICDDPKCPYHGNIKIRGILIEGKLISKKMSKAGVLLREYLHYVKKYKRYEKRRSRIPVYIPPCIDVSEGDIIVAGECKPLSKTISFVVVANKSRGG
ncbi:TPA: 30S ribosomal protein S17 [Candidatus Geothermarchaeota archaeon]|nr:30S ribosomal protein S17 [Candidatus Geothermarchaeota archaeon]HIQ12913.1 30S ribosomal protein S17 [Thermoprotei archaeon]